jgi:hypothetical protein
MFTVYYLIQILCTQASFYYPFSVVHNIYTLPEAGIHIIPCTDYPNINIIENTDSVDIIFKKIFKYTDINSDQVMTKFHTYMVITINLAEEQNGYIFNGKKYGICDTAMLYWIKENNLLVI